MTVHLLQARNLTKRFRLKSGLFAKTASHTAVDAVDLDLAPRQRIGIVGESGSGKSTLGRLLLGLTKPSEGEVSFEAKAHADRSHKDWKRFRMRTSLVQQNPLSALNPQMSIGEQVAEAVIVHRVADRRGALERAASMLDRVGLSSAMMERFPHQLSGGQRQRVVIARALILHPKFVVFDEAVSALDVSVQAQVASILRDLWHELELGYVFITHDLRIVRHLVDRIAVMYLGRIVETGDIKSVYSGPRHPYTKALLASVPTMDPRVRNVAPPLQGELDIHQLSRGCAFRSRCPLAIERCATEVPLLRKMDRQFAACHRAEELPRPAIARMEMAL
ncbi:oligopeptide/dipeptide ABC transporter ATP-binding protein [uncultured Devosia sp.]|uniref:oligopeptide/dipeptide ABC transporter ATP-binding protein n=1 Tax=uncultured Devosia sp. TaxID=211434 RepID=UPI0035C9E740